MSSNMLSFTAFHVSGVGYLSIFLAYEYAYIELLHADFRVSFPGALSTSLAYHRAYCGSLQAAALVIIQPGWH